MLKLPSQLIRSCSLHSILVTTILIGFSVAQSATPNRPVPAPGNTSPGNVPSQTATVNGVPRYRPSVPKRALDYYQTQWGVDSFGAKAVEGGEMIRFSYRVLDPQKAAPLNDKRNEPSLVDEIVHARLVIPALEKVGKLRQTSTPEAGKVYWMAFSNKERYVKRGHRVSVVIGKFRVDRVLVE